MQTYTTNHAPSVLQTHSWRTLTNSASYLLPYLHPNMRILDIGCGPGSITLDFARHVPTGHITGLDSSPDPLPTARSLAASQNLTNIEFLVGDIHSLPFESNTFDLVHVHQVLQHIADPVQALREMRRVAKPNGIVAARESSSMSWYPANEGLELWWEVTGRMGREMGGNPHPGNRIHVWAVEAGFERGSVRRSAGTWCFSGDEERRYWGGSMAGRARESGFVDLALKGGFAGREELGRIVSGWEEWVDCEDGWFGVLHGEIVCFK
ncbi:S-adenosyl-L-methionine-dependent methyltransferase [Aspergillus sclerotiicarbonarius CBS 121057]|uniref:S-adenosyl-L-methionine-dependent methyltransferase n=1 Tax=Aspergillus sclerotiicarbonarius (strain CBS 121057 / IBT 28362) TaxID=1448318 RepID=A0A319EUM3_ASPSB|nr:S-adenosyl-L-methionine-dependent methyltransferase [Aspergillus sclerotiicarbonarius CBS 121057]